MSKYLNPFYADKVLDSEWIEIYTKVMALGFGLICVVIFGSFISWGVSFLGLRFLIAGLALFYSANIHAACIELYQYFKGNDK